MLRPRRKPEARRRHLQAPVTYKQAGVDIDCADRFVDRISDLVASTKREGVLGDIGAFGGFFALGRHRYRDPVFVSGTDGVGTKVKVASWTGCFDTVGIDLVAMCVNDILVHGAEPLFFLDYLAVGKLDIDQAEQLIAGVASGCRQAGCALIGGETAELPGIYPEGEFDMAGFAVGVVERRRLLDGSRVRPGDCIIGLASSGLHSNGYSLARKILIEREKLKPAARLPSLRRTIGEELIRPTRIYVKPVLAILRRFDVHAMAHITGGGIPGNLVRVLPKGTRATVQKGSWPKPPIFEVIAGMGPVTEEEMYNVFNMGLGMMLVVPHGAADRICRRLRELGEKCFRVGIIERGKQEVILKQGLGRP